VDRAEARSGSVWHCWKQNFSSNPSGHTAEKKRRKRNMGCYGLLPVPRQPFSPLPLPPPHIARVWHRLQLRYQD
jgi:hypothetical protein